MSLINVINSFISYYQCSVIYIKSQDSSLYISDVYFSNCFSENEGCAVYFVSLDSTIKKICGENCSSTNNLQPGGAFLKLDHTDDIGTYANTLSMVSISKTPNNINAYSVITLNYGLIHCDNVNSTSNIALTNPVCCLWQPASEQTAFASFINGIDCESQNEVVFSAFDSQQIAHMNLINNSCLNKENAIFRSYGAQTVIIDSIFLNNKGNLFIACETYSSIQLNNCYFPYDAIKIGSGLIDGNPITESKTNEITFDKCFYKSFCSIPQNVKKSILNFTIKETSIFLLTS